MSKQNDIIIAMKKALEDVGHQNVNVWFEEPDTEKEYEGGWVFTSNTTVNGVEHNYFDMLGNDISDVSSTAEEYRIVN